MDHCLLQYCTNCFIWVNIFILIPIKIIFKQLIHFRLHHLVQVMSIHWSSPMFSRISFGHKVNSIPKIMQLMCNRLHRLIQWNNFGTLIAILDVLQVCFFFSSSCYLFVLFLFYFNWWETFGSNKFASMLSHFCWEINTSLDCDLIPIVTILTICRLLNCPLTRAVFTLNIENFKLHKSFYYPLS